MLHGEKIRVPFQCYMVEVNRSGTAPFHFTSTDGGSSMIVFWNWQVDCGPAENAIRCEGPVRRGPAANAIRSPWFRCVIQISPWTGLHW